MTAPVPTKPYTPVRARTPQAFFTPIQREFDRLFDQLGAGWANLTEFEFSPSIDVRDTKDGLEITVEVPGMAQDDVKVTIEDDVLTISGEKKSQSEKTEGGYRVAERSYGSFSRSISLPSTVDAEKLSASMKDGVLKLIAPKNGKSKAKTIEIRPSA